VLEIKKVVSQNPYDYLYLYTNIYEENGKYYTNEKLIYNTAVRNYICDHKIEKEIDEKWVIKNINTYGYDVYQYKS